MQSIINWLAQDHLTLSILGLFATVYLFINALKDFFGGNE